MRIPIQNRKQWLDLRKADVTASVAGALLGIHDYQTPYGLWAEKSGKLATDVEATPAMERGLLLEPVALKLLQQQKPDWNVAWNGKPGEIGGDYFRDPDARIGATIDAFAHPKHGIGVIQFKTVEASTFRRKWMNEDSEVNVPLWIAVQTIIEADLGGAEWGAVAAMVIGYGIDLHVIDVPIHQGILSQIRIKVDDFWRRVRQNDPPPADYGRDGETIASIYKADNGQTADLRGDNALPVALYRRERVMEELTALNREKEALTAEIKLKVGENQAALVQGWRITAKITNVPARYQEAYSYRPLRVKRLEDKP